MTIEKLKRYRELKSELEDLEQNTPVVQDSVQGSQAEFPNIKQNHRISGVEPVNYDKLERKSDLKAQIKEIESFVRRIDDSIVRKAINLKFIEIKKNHNQKRMPAPKWYQVAQQVDCGLGGDGLRMRVKRYLKKF